MTPIPSYSQKSTSHIINDRSQCVDMLFIDNVGEYRLEISNCKQFRWRNAVSTTHLLFATACETDHLAETGFYGISAQLFYARRGSASNGTWSTFCYLWWREFVVLLDLVGTSKSDISITCYNVVSTLFYRSIIIVSELESFGFCYFIYLVFLMGHEEFPK